MNKPREAVASLTDTVRFTKSNVASAALVTGIVSLIASQARADGGSDSSMSFAIPERGPAHTFKVEVRDHRSGQQAIIKTDPRDLTFDPDECDVTAVQGEMAHHNQNQITLSCDDGRYLYKSPGTLPNHKMGASSPVTVERILPPVPGKRGTANTQPQTVDLLLSDVSGAVNAQFAPGGRGLSGKWTCNNYPNPLTNETTFLCWDRRERNFLGSQLKPSQTSSVAKNRLMKPVIQER